jgi:hypothetical protein
MKTVIIISSHNTGSKPHHEQGYLSVMAGSALYPDIIPSEYQRDDSGENISEKNREYCELTALYWAWKNLDSDNIGLCHYRRFFASPLNRKSFLKVYEAEQFLEYYDVLLPRERNYVFETNYSQYVNSHHSADLDATRQIIEEKHPEYLSPFDKRMSASKGHRFNMFIMKKELADGYCEWLFDILSELECRLDISSYSMKDKRVFGYVAERLLDVWIDAHELRTTDLDYIFIGKEHLIQKAAAMIIRKVKAAVKTK